MEEATIIRRKRKRTAVQDGVELSKRLKRLNLERDGQSLQLPIKKVLTPTSPDLLPRSEDYYMQLDNTKYKVYIHNIDDELSDSETSSSDDDGKLVFLPDIEKRIRDFRIPRSILAAPADNKCNNQQLVLYNIPSSLSVPEEKDSVRKAIIETRARAKARDLVRNEGIQGGAASSTASASASASVQQVKTGCWIGAATGPATATAMPAFDNVEFGMPVCAMDDYDPDAMDLC